MKWTEKFNDKANYTLEGLMTDYYYQSIDRDQAVYNGKALYDYYRLINNHTGEHELVTYEQMEAWCKAVNAEQMEAWSI